MEIMNLNEHRNMLLSFFYGYVILRKRVSKPPLKIYVKNILLVFLKKLKHFWCKSVVLEYYFVLFVLPNLTRSENI